MKSSENTRNNEFQKQPLNAKNFVQGNNVQGLSFGQANNANGKTENSQKPISFSNNSLPNRLGSMNQANRANSASSNMNHLNANRNNFDSINALNISFEQFKD